jgi:16S rRNA (adenine1518-N6/adenine1519-N6)-dimethyltransferase
VVDVGAGFGSLTIALAGAGADVLAIEFDRGVVAALHEVVDRMSNVTVVRADALRIDWASALGGRDWVMAANLPYNVAVPLLLRMLEEASDVTSYVAMVQREVADRLAAVPGSLAYGAVSVKVAYRAEVTTLRRVPREVFWPRPRVESTVLRLTPRAPRVGIEPAALFHVVDVSFGERRKTMRNAIRRLGLDATAAVEALRRAGIDPSARPEELALEDFGRLTRGLVNDGVVSEG